MSGLVWMTLGLLAGPLAAAAITVNINSGNPRYPYPQFLDYGAGRLSLASHNPVGVPHAEMEQRGRDACPSSVRIASRSGARSMSPMSLMRTP